MRISIALATYRGELFLTEQLASLAAQSRLPDELVASDDASDDGTLALLERFAAQAPFPVQILRHPFNQGTPLNFTAALEHTTGDLILLADQDDLWMPDKIARLCEAAAESPDVSFLFSNARLIDAAGSKLAGSLWQSLGLSRGDCRLLAAGDALPVLLRRCAVTGATLAFRSEWRSLLLPVPQGWIHDAWWTLLLACVGQSRAIAEPLIAYRQHAAQQIGARRRRWFDALHWMRSRSRRDFEIWADGFAIAAERLERLPPSPGIARSLALLERKIAHCQSRIRLRNATWSRPLGIAGELISGRYHSLSRGLISALDDLLP